ncbi:MAG: DUF2156 domain-containing protein [Saprospiraceae bacterium]|nr:DUF2156 domain-containing protein [Pyrinomonadaceae bacterium]
MRYELEPEAVENGSLAPAIKNPVSTAPGSDFSRVRELILKHGWNSTCFQIVNPGIEYWFGSNNESVVGYVSTATTRVVAGAPVCREEDLPGVVIEFESNSKNANQTVCYFGAEARLESVLKKSDDHSKILLGAQPCWNPSRWPEIVAGHSSLRAQLNRARNKGVTVTEWPIDRARDNAELNECLSVWLSSKGLPPLHFMVEPDTLGRLENRRILVAEHKQKVVGFLLLSPIPNRNGWLTEQFPHRPSAPNGTVELMMDAGMRALGEGRYEYVTLGLAPLSKRAKIEPFDNPLWLRLLLAWMRKHGQRFYNFDGLDSFKAKLAPDRWEPIFAISNEPEFSGGTLYSIASAFSGNEPFRLISGGLFRAAQTEIARFKKFLFRKPSAETK